MIVYLFICLKLVFYICSTLSNDRLFVYLFEVSVLCWQYTKQCSFIFMDKLFVFY